MGNQRYSHPRLGGRNGGGEVEDTHAFIPHLRQSEVNGFCLGDGSRNIYVYYLKVVVNP